MYQRSRSGIPTLNSASIPDLCFLALHRCKLCGKQASGTRECWEGHANRGATEQTRREYAMTRQSSACRHWLRLGVKNKNTWVHLAVKNAQEADAFFFFFLCLTWSIRVCRHKLLALRVLQRHVFLYMFLKSACFVHRVLQRL